MVLNYNTLRWDQAIVCPLLIVCCYQKDLNRFMRAVLGMLSVAVLYDVMPQVTPYFHSINPPKAKWLYDLEISLFGITNYEGKKITLCEWWMDHYTTWLDLPCAFAYCIFLWQSIGFGIYLYCSGRWTHLRRFSWVWGVVNYLGFITYYVLPASPPWYVLNHGFEPVDFSVKSNPARLVAVDDFLGIPYFKGFYGRNASVHGALPSLHCAYPFLCWLACRPIHYKLSWLFLGNSILTGFAAVYLCHHYLIDVGLGVMYAGFSYWLINSICDGLEARDKRLGLSTHDANEGSSKTAVSPSKKKSKKLE